MSSFTSLYSDMHLCILEWLPTPDLVTMVRVCKSLGAVVGRVRITQGIELKPVRNQATSQYAPPPLPDPRRTLRHLVTSFGCDSMDLLSSCSPWTLRERCPGLMSLGLSFRSVDAASLEELLEYGPDSFWPASLHTLSLSWYGLFSEVSSIAALAAQLRLMLLTGARIPSLTSLSLDATGYFDIRDEEEDMFRNAAPFPPCLAPLAQLPQLCTLAINIELQCADSGCGETSSRWVSDTDCSVICSLPALCHLNINDGHLSRDGLLPHLLHSSEADALRQRLRSLTFSDWTSFDQSSASPALFTQLQLACPLMAAASPRSQ